jgi:hypothetical protein
MARLEYVEGQIYRLEGFRVAFRHEGPARRPGRDVRSDRLDVPGYKNRRKMSDDFTVAAWIETRFAKQYPGFAVDVLGPDGGKVNGRTKLGNLRAKYDA